MTGRTFLLALCAAATIGSAMYGQTPAAPAAAQSVPEGGEPSYIRPETPEQRQARLGTQEDPGTNPDPSKHYIRFGKSYHIEKFDRRWENSEGVEPGYIRPFGFVNVQREIYQRNEKWVWVWMPDAPPEPPAEEETSRYNSEQLSYLQNMRSEFSELTPKASAKVVRFTESSEGLPTSGSWRNNLAVADMNGDGCPDLIAPAERKGGGAPAIFLGDCKGHWSLWRTVQWPASIDYGSAVAADFNKDGHMDLAFGVHLKGIYVMLGDGKGNFKEVSSGLPRDFPTRRLAVADVDGDGYPDIIGLSEGPTMAQVPGSGKQGGKLRVYLNKKKGTSWQEIDVADAQSHVAGDWLTVAHLTGDRHPDLIAATIYMNSNQVVFVSDGPKKWKSLGSEGPYLVPYLSNYAANAAGKFSSRKLDDAIISYVRAWPSDVPERLVPEPPSRNIVGLDRISFAGKTPQRTPIMRWESNRIVTGVATGDFDGDGNLDLIFTRSDPREAVLLLGDGKGGFSRANIEGLNLEINPNYDIKVADVNGDGKPDVIVMYESTAATAFAEANGSIHVFLNRGAAPVASQAQK